MIKEKKYTSIFVAMIGMLVILICAMSGSSPEYMEQVQFVDQVQFQTLTPYYDETEDTYILFLPAYLKPDQIMVNCKAGNKLSKQDGVEIESLQDFPQGEPVEVRITSFFTERDYRLQIEQAENITSLYIEMQHGGLERIHEDKNNQEDVFVRFVDANGEMIFQDIAAMNGRGNGTWSDQAKRPYNLSFSSIVSIGPFENVSKLCLMAEYSDESKMRNALAYYCGKEMNIPYASDYMYADIYMNGEYFGIYGICTKQEYEKRVDADSIQAVFEISSNVEDEHFITEQSGRTISILYGNTEMIRQKVNQMEQALEDHNWKACAELIDLQSWAYKYVLDEFIGDVDMGYASQYFYIDQEGKIKSMLPWDYDWSLGSCITFFNKEHAYGLMTMRSPNFWMTVLLNNEDFLNEIRFVVNETLSDEFLNNLYNYAWEVNAYIDKSRTCDFLRWENERPFKTDNFRSGYVKMEELTQFFCNYFAARRNHMQSFFSNPDDFALVEFRGSYTYYFNYLIPKGDCLFDYLIQTEKLTGEHDGYQVNGWFTGADNRLEEIDTVSENITFHMDGIELEPNMDLVILEEKSLSEKITEFSVELSIMGIFGLLALVLFAIEVKRMIGRKQVKV